MGLKPLRSSSIATQKLPAQSPAGSSGTVDVTVIDPSGTSATSVADEFNYEPGPVVATIAPTSGSTSGGTSVTITGSGCTGATAVNFGATASPSFTVVSDSQITATSPAENAGLVDVTVTTTGGTSATSSADVYVFTSSAGCTETWTGATNSNSGHLIELVERERAELWRRSLHSRRSIESSRRCEFVYLEFDQVPQQPGILGD